MLVAALSPSTWGRGWVGAMAPAPLSTGPQSFTPLPTIKPGPSGAGSRVGGLVHALGPCGSLRRPLLWGWESLLLPLNPHGLFQSEVWGFLSPRSSPGLCGLLRSPPFVQFICARMWGHGVLPATLPASFSATLSPALSVYLCANVGPQGLPVVGLPATFVPHSASLGPASATRVLSALVPISTPPTGLDECLFFISLVSDFLAVWFSVSSGCARRRSVSTYAAILVLHVYSIVKFFMVAVEPT